MTLTAEERLQRYRTVLDNDDARHVDIADARQTPIVTLDATPDRPRRILIAATALAASALVIGGLVVLGRSPTDDGIASTAPPTGPTEVISSTTPATESTDVPTTTPVPSTTEPLRATAAPTIAPDTPLASASLFDLYDQLSAARTISFDAIDRETQQCMNEKGFDNVPTPTSLLADSHNSGDSLSWRFPTEQQAASTGYQRATDTLIIVGEPPEGTPEFAALYGNIVGTWVYPDAPDGFGVEGPIYDGCFPTAQIRVIGNGDPKASFRINDYDHRLQRVLYPAIQFVTTTPEFIAAQAVWVQCMKDGGFNVADVADPAARSWSSPRPSPAEISMATADDACKSSTGIRELGDRLFNEQVTAWFGTHPDDRQEIIDYVAGVIDRSASIAAPVTTP